MTTTFAPANLQWLGIAKETTNGTPISAPTLWIPVDSPTWVPTRPPLVDTALRGSMAAEYEQLQGQGFDTITYKTNFYLDSIYPHLLAILGNADTVTGTAVPYTHKTALYNGSGGDAAQPKSYTIFYNDGAGKVQQMPGAIPSSVKITVKPDGLAELDVTWIGLPSTAIAPPTNTPTTSKPMPGWNATITVGGTPLNSYSEVDIEYKRATEIIPSITGSQTPFAIFGGPVSVSGTLTAVYQGFTGDVNMVDFLANTQPVLLVKVAPAGDAVNSITFQHSKVAYDSSAPSGTTKWMEIKSSIKALANTTDALGGGYSPAQVILLNSQSTAY